MGIVWRSNRDLKRSAHLAIRDLVDCRDLPMSCTHRWALRTDAQIELQRCARDAWIPDPYSFASLCRDHGEGGRAGACTCHGRSTGRATATVVSAGTDRDPAVARAFLCAGCEDGASMTTVTTDPREGQRACADCKFRRVDRCAAFWNERCITVNINANCLRWKLEQPTPVLDLSPISTFGFWIAVGIVFSSLIAKVWP